MINFPSGWASADARCCRYTHENPKLFRYQYEAHNPLCLIKFQFHLTDAPRDYFRVEFIEHKNNPSLLVSDDLAFHVEWRGSSHPPRRQLSGNHRRGRRCDYLNFMGLLSRPSAQYRSVTNFKTVQLQTNHSLLLIRPQKLVLNYIYKEYEETV